ncbi:MAG: MFS transporter [Bacteroidota bacterium]|nr:MFS transporter [Bacteroidota bacterium]
MPKFAQRWFSGLSRNVIFLSLTSLFGDISTEMLYPILPVYLTQTLKASGGVLGLIEGMAQAIQNVAQGFSGFLSDKWQRKKPIALAGFILAALAKPLLGLASTWQFALGARLADRLGAGTRSAPRDALIAESVEPKYRGKAFGLEGFGDNLGAFLGPVITVLLFLFFQLNIHTVFFLAFIPGGIAALLVLFVKERKIRPEGSPKIEMHFREFPAAYWRYLMITALFGIGNSSNSFLILQLKGKGISLTVTVLIYALFNLLAALISYPAGSLSDKLGRRPVLLVSFIIFFIAYAGFAMTTGFFLTAILFVFYGLFQGVFRSVGKSYATDLVPAHLRASGIGWYSTTVGISGLIASIVAGQLWDKVSHTAVFVYGAAISSIGIVSLCLFKGKAPRAD